MEHSLYAASSDLKRVRALNGPATELVGNQGIPVPGLRELKAGQWSAYMASLPADVPDDAVGAAPSSNGPGGSGSSWAPGLVIALAGAVLVGGAAFLLGHSTRARPLARTSTGQ